MGFNRMCLTHVSPRMCLTHVSPRMVGVYGGFPRMVGVYGGFPRMVGVYGGFPRRFRVVLFLLEYVYDLSRPKRLGPTLLVLFTFDINVIPKSTKRRNKKKILRFYIEYPTIHTG